MGTHAVIEFKKANVDVFTHYDGYPSGTALKIANAIKHKLHFEKHNVRNVNFLNAFVAGNITECFIIDDRDDVYPYDYYYIVDEYKETIEVYNENKLFLNEYSFVEFVESFPIHIGEDDKVVLTKSHGTISVSSIEKLSESYMKDYYKFTVDSKVNDNPNAKHAVEVLKELEEIAKDKE